jgi:hypothetical protein
MKQLREAIEQRDWNAVRAALQQPLSMLAPSELHDLVRGQLLARLPNFEREHPGVVWARALLTQGIGVPPPDGEYAGPGGNNFDHAIAAFVASQHAADGSERTLHAIDALAEAVMSELCARWGAKFPDRWQAWYRNALSGTEASAPDTLLDMMNDPAIKQAEHRAWSDIADDVWRRLDTI